MGISIHMNNLVSRSVRWTTLWKLANQTEWTSSRQLEVLPIVFRAQWLFERQIEQRVTSAKAKKREKRCLSAQTWRGYLLLNKEWQRLAGFDIGEKMEEKMRTSLGSSAEGSYSQGRAGPRERFTSFRASLPRPLPIPTVLTDRTGSDVIHITSSHSLVRSPILFSRRMTASQLRLLGYSAPGSIHVSTYAIAPNSSMPKSL